MRIVFEVDRQPASQILWRWSVDNDLGLRVEGDASTYWGAQRRARRAMHRIQGIIKEVPHPGLLGIPEEDA